MSYVFVFEIFNKDKELVGTLSFDNASSASVGVRGMLDTGFLVTWEGLPIVKTIEEPYYPGEDDDIPF